MSVYFNYPLKQRVKELNILLYSLKKYQWALGWKYRHAVFALINIINSELSDIDSYMKEKKKKEELESAKFKQIKLDI